MNVETQNLVYIRDSIFKEDEFLSIKALMDTPKALEFPHTTANPNPSALATPRMIPPPEPTMAAPRSLPPMNELLKRTHYSFAADTHSTPPSKRVRFPDEPLPCVLTADEDTHDGHERLTLIYTLLAIRYVAEPSSYREAVPSTSSFERLKATPSEYKSNMDNGTWSLVQRLEDVGLDGQMQWNRQCRPL